MSLVDPYVRLGLDDVLKPYGLQFEDDLVVYRGPTATGEVVTLPLAVIYQGGFSSQPITTKFAQANLQLLIQDARSISMPSDHTQNIAKTQFLLQTDTNSWGWISKNGAPPADPKQLTFDKTTDIAGPVNVAAQYDGGTTTDPQTKATMFATRIVVIGASKFLENDTADSVGANLFTNSIDWLVKKDAVLDIAPKKSQQYGRFSESDFLPYRRLVRRRFNSGSRLDAGRLHVVLAPQITFAPVCFVTVPPIFTWPSPSGCFATWRSSIKSCPARKSSSRPKASSSTSIPTK